MSVYSSKVFVALILISILVGFAVVKVTLLGPPLHSPDNGLTEPLAPAFRIILPSNIDVHQGNSCNLTVKVTWLPYPRDRAITSETPLFLSIHLNPYPSSTAGILPEGVTATFNPPFVILQPWGEANSTLTLEVDSVAQPGRYFLTVAVGYRWGNDRTSMMGASLYLTVYGNNPPPQRPVHELKANISLVPGVLLGMPDTVKAYSENYIEALIRNLGSSREENVTVQIFIDGVKFQDATLSLAGYPETYDTDSLLGTYKLFQKRWVPLTIKTYNITVVASNPYTYAQDSIEVNVI